MMPADDARGICVIYGWMRWQVLLGGTVVEDRKRKKDEDGEEEDGEGDMAKRQRLE